MLKKKMTYRKGSSMLIAIGVAAILILMAVGVAALVTSSLESTIRVQAKNEAFFAAEGGIELALYDLYRHGAGYEVNPDENWTLPNEVEKGYFYLGREKVYDTEAEIDDTSADDNRLENDTYAWWGIRSLVEWDGGDYRIPARGEGNAGQDCDTGSGWLTDNSHACNWNKINLVTPASIDLYRDVSKPGEDPTYEHFHDIDSNIREDSLEVRIRIPQGVSDDLEEGNTVDTDPTLVGWTFSGEAIGDDFQRKFWPDISREERGNNIVRTSSNTEITASALNGGVKMEGGSALCGPHMSGTEYLTLDLGTHGLNTFEEGKGECGVTALNTFFENGGLFLTKFANLKLSLIGSLITDGGDAVEHLEYQVIADREIPDAYVTIESTGVSGDYPWLFKQKIQTKVRQNASVPVFDFVFIEG